MSKDPRDPYRHVPPGLTGEERRKWWERQRRKWVWGPCDILFRGDNGMWSEVSEQCRKVGREDLPEHIRKKWPQQAELLDRA